MEKTLKKTTDWVKQNQKLLDRSSFIITHDPVSSNPIMHKLFVHGQQTLVFDHILADTTFKETYLTLDAGTKEQVVLGVTKAPIPIDHDELRVLDKLSKLNLPGIVSIKKITYLPTGQKAILSGFCNGGDLEQRIKTKALTKKEKELLSKAIIEAVKALHQHGILHRDLKTANILLSVDRKNKILNGYLNDFGQSTLLEDPHSLSHIEHNHAPPEANIVMEKHSEALLKWRQLEEEKLKGPVDPQRVEEVDKAVEPFTDEFRPIACSTAYDCWGLGLILYCLWNRSTSNDFPWAKASAEQNYGEIAKQKYLFVKTLVNLPEPIKVLLDADPEKRVIASF